MDGWLTESDNNGVLDAWLRERAELDVLGELNLLTIQRAADALSLGRLCRSPCCRGLL